LPKNCPHSAFSKKGSALTAAALFRRQWGGCESNVRALVAAHLWGASAGGHIWGVGRGASAVERCCWWRGIGSGAGAVANGDSDALLGLLGLAWLALLRKGSGR